MADGLATTDPDDFVFGDAIERLLDRLSASGLHVGPRERVMTIALGVRWLESRQLTEAGHTGVGPDAGVGLVRDLRPVLAPLLARTREERATYFQVFDAMFPADVQRPDGLRRKRSKRKAERHEIHGSRWIGVLLGAMVVIALMAFATLAVNEWSRARAPTPFAVPLAPARPPIILPPRRGAAPGDEANKVREAETLYQLLGRVLDGSREAAYAPTLNEIAAFVVMNGASLGNADNLPGGGDAWTAATYAMRLHELTGLPRDTPLPLLGAGEPDGLIWARVAQALGRIEEPGREPPLDVLAQEADIAIQTSDRPRVYKIADRLPTIFPDRNVLPATVAEIAERISADTDTGDGPGSDIARAFALQGYPLDAFTNLPWRMAREPRIASTVPPSWLPWVAAGLPLALAFIFASALAIKRPYLRRRAPRVPPTHADIVANAGNRASFDAGLFQRAAARLLARTPRPSIEIDVQATIVATLKTGGEIITPVYSTARSRPEYLVLIERAASGDHEARRLRQMLERLNVLIDFDVYYFQTDPGELEAETGALRISIEQAQSRHPDHRLIILGSGAGLLEPGTMLPNDPARLLLFWPRRALLTTIPVAEWGREEYAIAEGLALPIGRATPEGFLALADMLGLQGAEPDPRPDPHGDGLARPLPDILRRRPQRFLFGTPPDAATLQQLMREIRNTLDPAGFDWLAALAVYPSVQWDLTLFLGVELPRKPRGNAASDPLYDESRLAAITQLPWLRAGRMPNWLRRELLDRLSPQRAREVRTALIKAIEDGQQSSGAATESITLRIGREQPGEKSTTARQFEDEVLLDFLAAGNREDFALAQLPKRLSEIFDRTFWERLGGPEGLAGGAALVFALAAFAISPRSSEGALTTGALGPLMILVLGGAAAILLWKPWRFAGATAGLLERFVPAALAVCLFAALGAGVLLARGALQGSAPWVSPDIFFSSPWISTGFAAPLFLLCLWASRSLCERVGVRIFAEPLGSVGSWLGLSVKAIILAIGCLVFLRFAPAVAGLTGDRVDMTALVALLGASAILFVIGVVAGRLAPEPEGVTSGRPAEPAAGPLTTGWRVLVAGAPVVLATLLFLAVGRGQSRVDFEAAPEIAAVSADGGIIALADATGRIVMARSDGTTIATIESRSVSAIAVAVANGKAVAAFSDTDGHVFQWKEASGMVESVDDPDLGGPLRSLGVPPQLKFSPAGVLSVAAEYEGETRVVTDGEAENLSGVSGPPLALAVARDRIAIATLAGDVLVIRGNQVALLDSPGNKGLPARLMEYGPSGELRVVLIDGTVMTAAPEATSLEPAGKAPPLALGSAVPWKFERR